tara:strand:- start:3583 stop:4812 length:1230 start_codon:yes stop_codon:yes gene_type:complete
MRDYQIISADSHVEAPPELWTKRMPKHLQDRAPKAVELPGGGVGLDLGQGAPRDISIGLQAGVKYKDLVNGGLSWDQTKPGCGDGEQRIREIDQDGIDGELLFCSVAAQLAKSSKDREIVVESVKAYNDWILEDFNSVDPDRLFGLPMLPTSGVKDAIAEMERVAKKMTHFRAVQPLRFPSGGGNLSDEDEPFWAAAQDLDLTITSHHNFGTAGQLAVPEIQGKNKEDLNFFTFLLTGDLPVPTLPIFTILQLMVDGVLDRYPKLRFFFAETYIGWIPYWMEQMDDRYDRHNHWCGVQLPRRPSDYLRDQFAFTFNEDHVGVQLRDHIGVDNICWASDMPHPVSDWPYSIETCARQFRGLPNEDRRKLQALNVLDWIGAITPKQKAEMAKMPVIDNAPADIPARGARRM